MISAVLVRYLAVSHTFAALRLLRMTDRDKDVEILALRHRFAVLQRQLGWPGRPRTVASIRRLVLRLATGNPDRQDRGAGVIHEYRWVA